MNSLEAYQLFGMSGPDVTSIDVLLTNGVRVPATVQSGLWGIWWPAENGDPTGSRLEITTATGTRTVSAERLLLPEHDHPR